MGWQLSGRSVELCSCKMLCPCWLGPEGSPDPVAHLVSTFSAAIPRASISTEPKSLSQRSGQAISLAAKERLVCTSATVQMASSVASWRRSFRGKRVACSKDCGAP